MPAKTLATLALAASLTATASAETLLLPTNSGFETDTFSVAPGYISGNGPITGWTESSASQVGLNPTTAPSSDFANNGLIPEGSQVAFIQSNSSTTSLSQAVSGFTVGDRYVLWYRENSRSGYAVPTVSATLDASTVVAGHGVTAVGGANAYRTTIGTPFTATSGTHTLAFSSSTVGDGAATIDDVRLYGYSSDEIIVLNSSFEWDTFGTFPGYSSGAANGPISGWTSSNATRTGINPAAGSPFADNGAVPDGSQVAFIQNFSDGTTGTLSQTINGLTIGETYRIDRRTNARDGNTGQLMATFGGDTLVSGQNVTAVGGANPYHTYSFLVTATATSQTLTFANTAAAGDNTLLLDAISVTENPAWTGTAWTGDADSGIVAHGATTHAYNLGQSPGNTTINGVNFFAVAGTSPGASNFSLAGYTSQFNNDSDNNLTGGSLQIADDFVYGGAPGTLTLTGLLPGSTNVLTLYGTGWDGAGANSNRAATFTDTGTGDSFTFNENQYGQNNGVKVQYTYVADASGTAVITISPETAQTFHIYGLANQVQGYRNLFTDNYNTTGNTQDINPGGLDEFGRQSGVYAPLTYAENVGGQGNFTQLGNPGAGADRLFLATQNGVLGYTAVSPNASFVVNPSGLNHYQIMFDVNPANAENVGTDVDTTDWASFIFGASSQNAFVNASDGIGMLIRGNGGYQIFDGTAGGNVLRADGDLGTDFGIDENDWYHVRIEFEVGAFDDLTQGLITLFVDEVQVASFTSLGGFADNFVTLGGNNSAGNILVHGFDNLQVWTTIPAPAALPAGLAMLLTVAARRRR